LRQSNALIVNECSLSAETTSIDPELLKIGDFVKVTNGQTFPIDGIVCAGSGMANESMLTGEEKLISKNVGVSVYGGTMLVRGSVVVKVVKILDKATFN